MSGIAIVKGMCVEGTSVDGDTITIGGGIADMSLE